MSNCYVHPIGGLGNQLFQIAAGYVYSKKYDKKLVIDPTHWNVCQGNHVLSYKDTIFKNFEYGSTITGDVIEILEKQFNYSELPYHPGNVSLNGYFQSLKYFEEYKNEFINLLNLPEVDNEYLKCGRPISIGFHIRRGDYLKYPNIHYICDTKYFDYFFDIFNMTKNDSSICVFTDSPDHILKEFKQEYQIIKSNSDLKELAYMSQCDIIVGSNSTFSWWASLIGGKNCYFPSKWFGDGRPHEDIFRKDMILKNV
jgi:hypothetical protein